MSSAELYRRLGAKQLTARSVIASTLLGSTPPELPTRSLVGTAQLLGIAPGTARVAMSRMVTAGELEATGDGYRLVGPTLLARQDRQARSRRGTTQPWDGDWQMFVVTGDARPQSERVEFRATMSGLRYGELREGVWARPDNLTRTVDPCDLGPVGAFIARPDRPVDLAALQKALDVRRTGWRIAAGGALASWTGDAPVLTDDYAPVDQLLQPYGASGSR